MILSLERPRDSSARATLPDGMCSAAQLGLVTDERVRAAHPLAVLAVQT